MKSIISVLISLFPFNFIRIFLYRVLLNYDINFSSKIGMFNLINVSKVTLKNAKIGFLNQIIVEKLMMKDEASIHKFNRVKNLNVLHINEGGEIRSKNFIGAPNKNVIIEGKNFEYQNLYIGQKSAVLRSNYFDVVNEIKVGDNVVFGGNGSEIWTHGFTTDRTMLVGGVEFGNNIFIGSNCIFTKGVKITDDVTIGPGSTIYKSIPQKGLYSTHKIDKVK